MELRAGNREAWLKDCGDALTETIQKVSGKSVPAYRISCGWPTRNALSVKRQTIGQCFPGMVSTDGKSELFISPVLAEPLKVAATVAHELIHANVGCEHGHRKPFAVVAKGIGLEGKMTATVAGEMFKQTVDPILKALGPYPHAEMVPSKKHKVAGTRLLKVICQESGYIARTTAVWLDMFGPPICPCCNAVMHAPDA